MREYFFYIKVVSNKLILCIKYDKYILINRMIYLGIKYGLINVSY